MSINHSLDPFSSEVFIAVKAGPGQGFDDINCSFSSKNFHCNKSGLRGHMVAMPLCKVLILFGGHHGLWISSCLDSVLYLLLHVTVTACDCYCM